MIDDLKVPRVEVGRWEDHQVTPKPKGETQFGESFATFSSYVIELNQGRKRVALCGRYKAPTNSWGVVCDEGLAFSGDGKLLWHLSYCEGGAQVRLLDGASLETLDTFAPIIRFDRYENREEKLQEWYELKTCVSPIAPQVLVVIINAGDSFYHLLTFEATENRIVDKVGTKLFNAVADCIDQTLWGGTFVAADRFVAIDDIGQVMLFSWPQAKQVARYFVGSGVRDDDYLIQLWPEDELKEDDNLIYEADLCLAGEVLLVSVCDGNALNPTRELRALVALDAKSLQPRGLVRPPRPGITGLHDLGHGRFGVVLGDKLHSWQFCE
jgi:hypothetical protein